MTKQEAISVLETIDAKTDYFLINDDARAEAIDMAIEALKAQDVPDKKSELKPCPFCGGEAELNVKHGSYGYTPDIYYVKCKCCGQKVEVVSERYKNLSDIVVGTWNRRASDDTTRG